MWFEFKNGNKKDIKIEKIDRNYTYTRMHKSIMADDTKIVCSFEEGKKIINIIENIEYKEL